MSDQVSVGDYSLEISGDEVVVRDESGTIVETVELADLHGGLRLPDGQQVDVATIFANQGVEAFQTAAGPANDNLGYIDGGPGVFHAFHITDTEFGGFSAEGTLGDTTLNFDAINTNDQPNYDPNAQEAPVQVTWSSHDPWHMAENQDGGSIGKVVNGNPSDFTFEVSDPRFEVVDGVLRVRDGVSFDYENEPGVDLEITATSRTGDVRTLSAHIDIDEVNEAQTGLSIDSSKIDENVAGAVVGTLTVADPDGNDSQSFFVSDSRFEVVDGQLKLKDGVSLDHESDPTLDVTVTVTDNGGNQIQRTFTIQVGDVNEEQMALTLDGNSVSENTAGAVIGALTVADPDAGDGQAFSVSDNRFEVVDGQLKLKDGISLDHEGEPTVNVTVTATDSAGHQIEQTFAITVGDVNEAQTALVLGSNTVAENTAGAVVGTLTVADPDAGDNQSFQVSDNRFEIVNGQLKLKDGISLDHEGEPTVSITVTATDSAGHQIQQAFAITVGDANEAPTGIDLSGNTLVENVQGAVIGALTAIDPDAGDTHTFGVSDYRFEVVNGQLKLKDGVSLDFESEPSLNVVVTTTDGAGKSVQETFTLSVGDVNEAQTGLALDQNQIMENAPGAIVGAATVTDPDVGDSQSFQVSDSRFEIVNGQLKLKDGVSLDHEGEPSVDVTVTATDSAGHQIQQTFAISVGDVNEAQTAMTLGGNQVAENAAGAVIGAVTVSDPDAGDSQSFAVSDNRFEVVNGQLKLKDGISLDHESEPTVNVQVTATDNGGHQVQQTFAISVGDVNEAQTGLSLNNSSVAENAAGAVVGSLTVTDPDAGDSQSFQVSDTRFEVVNGQLKLKDGISLDHESEPSVSVAVTAIDSAGHQIHQDFAVSVGDVNEAQTSVSLNNSSVLENAAGAVVGTLTVADPDAGDHQSFSVSDSRFEVVNSQLKLKSGVSLDHEGEPSVSVTVTATDDAGHQIQKNFAVSVGDVNEAPLSLSLTTDSAQLLLNGSFESNKLNSGQWQLFSGIDGWKTSTQIEVQNNVTNKASDGAQVVEMDADNKVDNIYQDVQTIAGHAYQLTFDTATRNDTKHTDTVEVYWNGVKIGSVEPQSTTWQSNTFQVIGTGGSDRLEFREVSGNNDNYGGLLDNVALKGMGTTVPENFGGVVIGSLQVTDPDVGDSHTFSVSDSRFEVVASQLKLKSGASFNYEAEQSVDVTVTATDAAGHQVQQTYTIKVGDVNEAQTALTWTGSSIAENAAGAVAGTLWVADVDAGDAQAFTVSDSRFEVVNSQLKLKSGVSLDYEQASSVNVTVTATDKVGHQIQQTFTVGVTNVNEAQTGMSLSASKVAENSAGVVIGTLSVSDPDAGDSQSFQVSDSRFEVVNNQLKLKSGVSLDFEQASSVNVTVTATDTAGHQYAQTFAIGVADVNEAPTSIQLSNLSVNENASGATIGKLTTSDPDAGDTFSYQVPDSRFQVVNGQLELKSGVSLDHEAEPTVNLKVTSTDSAGHAIQQSFTVNVANVNEAPVVTSNDGSFENHIVNTSTTYNPVANSTVGAYLYSNDSAGIAKPTSNLLNGVDPSNMTLSAATPVTVTFQKEAAGNHNMIGTYQYDNDGNIVAGSVKLVWLDASANSEGVLGSSMVKDFLGYSQSNSISLGTMAAGTHVGFFAISNGASDGTNKTLLTNAATGTNNQAAAMAAIAGQLSIKLDANGNGHVYVGNSQMNGAVFFTHNKTLNTDFNGSSDIDHMASGVNANLAHQLVVGVEDLAGGGDKDFNDVVFSVDLGTYNVNKMTQSSLQPTVDFSDVDSSTLSQAVIHTSGFQAGDLLNVPSSSAFSVSVNQSGDDYTITIVGKTGSETVDQYETFANAIYFSTTSKTEGERHIDYSVTDSGGLSSTVSTADIGVKNSYEISSSQLAGQSSLGAGDDLLHINTSSVGSLDMGDGHDTVHLGQQGMSFGHSLAANLHNVEVIDATGYGANNVALSINDVLDITDADNHLTVVGEKGDTITLSGDGSGNHWSVVSSDANFTTYAWSDPAHQAVVEISNQLNTQVS